MRLGITYRYAIFRYGYLGLDLGLTDRLVDGYRSSVDRLLAIAGELNLDLEV